MVKVKNQQTIRQLSYHFLKTNFRRNLITIAAIVLTSVLFTSILTASLSMMKSTMQTEMRNSMDGGHISAQNMTKDQYKRLIRDKGVNDYGLSIFIAPLTTVGDNKYQVELRYADDFYAGAVFSRPDTGTLPQKEDEIALSTLVLESMGIPAKIGEKVEITFNIDGKPIRDELVLSGYWQGDRANHAQMAWVSRTYCDQVIPLATEADLRDGADAGSYNLSIMKSNVFTLHNEVERLKTTYGFGDTAAEIKVNPAYDFFEEDSFPFATVIILILVIIASGYLIIYNIFQISVTSDIHAYGLLRNIGTTGRQLKRIVYNQAMILSAIGIPIGMVLGFLIGKLLTPYLVENSTNSVIATATNPLMFIGAALLSFITVLIGCTRPVKAVSKVSPIEAIRMSEGTQKKGRKTSRSGKATPFSMAIANVKRTKGKTFISILSLSLCLIMLNTVFGIVNGFDYEGYLDLLICGDYIMCQMHDGGIEGADVEAITPEVKKLITENKEVAEVAYTYFKESTHQLDDNGIAHLKENLEIMETDSHVNSDTLDSAKNAVRDGKITCYLMGINEAAFNKLEWKPDISWEAFTEGHYVLGDQIDYILGMKQEYPEYYAEGDLITLRYEENQLSDYQYAGMVSIPYSMGYKYGTPVVRQTFILPEEDYIALTGSESAMTAVIDGKEGTEDAIATWGNTVSKELGFSTGTNSKAEYRAEYSDFSEKFVTIGSIITVILFIIGIMNFFNTSVTTILNRRKELSILEAIGMTRKQILKMLISEGLISMGTAVLIAVTIGGYISQFLAMGMVGQIAFFNSTWNVVPALAAAPLLILVAVLIPWGNYKSMCRTSIVERIRTKN